MNRLPSLPCISLFLAALFFAASALSAEEGTTDTGAISGRISPPDASLRIIAKLAGTAAEVAGNVKGTATIAEDGAFTITGLPPGAHDLLFQLQGAAQKSYIATRWSEVVVQAGETTSGISYRLTPRGSPHLIDEVLVGFAQVSDAEARQAIHAAGCTVKDAPLELDSVTTYVVDIPDERSVAEMIEVFQQDTRVSYAEPNGIVMVDALKAP